MVKADVLDSNGKEKGKTDLPKVFSTDYRPDLIKRAVLASQSNRRQKYGSDKMAGKKTSAHYEGLTNTDPSQKMMQRGMSRMPREHGDTARFMRARFVPRAVGGRRAHPPKVEKNWSKKINKKERLLALKSAIGGTSIKELVQERNHIYNSNLPIVVEDSIQKMKKTKELLDFLNNLGLEKEISRTSRKKYKSGKGKLRRGKSKPRIGPLLVVGKDEGVSKKEKNIPGLEVVEANKINTETISPGAHGIRLTIWTKSSLDILSKMA